MIDYIQAPVLYPETKRDKIIGEINSLSRNLESNFKNKFQVTPIINRKIVSYQANKNRQQYRWYKYKEAFSATLVEYLLTEYKKEIKGIIIDPFAGSGTSIFASSELGYNAVGIELLPIGIEVIKTRLNLQKGLSDKECKRLLFWKNNHPWKHQKQRLSLPSLRITEGAYPQETLIQLEQYLAHLKNETTVIQNILKFALLCVLESISYTSKDGQYLRWDYRADRKYSSRNFQKSLILPFEKAITQKFEEILEDTRFYGQGELFGSIKKCGEIHIIEGSCLEILPTLESNSYNGLITSPPYCNRYDYTRTYALELALLGINEEQLSDLRQKMLSCTVENRCKSMINKWTNAIREANHQQLLQQILNFLNLELEEGRLNNKGIPRMIKGYFYEMSCVIAECFRILTSGSPFFMVNDNVRYAGIEIPVDIILSDIAQSLGFIVETILILPTGKGNSSQQMGLHGRKELRKCVYVWRKP